MRKNSNVKKIKDVFNNNFNIAYLPEDIEKILLSNNINIPLNKIKSDLELYSINSTRKTAINHYKTKFFYKVTGTKEYKLYDKTKQNLQKFNINDYDIEQIDILDSDSYINSNNEVIGIRKKLILCHNCGNDKDALKKQIKILLLSLK